MIDSNWTERLVINDSRVWVDISAKPTKKSARKRKSKLCARLCGRWVELTRDKSRCTICAHCRSHCLRCGEAFEGPVNKKRRYHPACGREVSKQWKRDHKEDPAWRASKNASYKRRYAKHKERRKKEMKEYYHKTKKEHPERLVNQRYLRKLRVAGLLPTTIRGSNGPRLENTSGEGSN